MTTYRLRGYQYDHVVKMTASESHHYRVMALIYGVGGGKTLTSLALASVWLDAEPNLALVVAVPQTAIAEQVINYAGHHFEFEGGTHRLPLSYTRRSATGHQVRSYLSTEGNRDKRMIVTHSSTLLHCEQEIRATLLAGRPMVFVIDEAHHSPEVGEEADPDDLKFANFIGQISRTHAHVRILKLTGTPYRFDNLQVLDDNTLVCSKRLIELMRDGYAPSTVLTDDVTLPANLEEAVARIVQKWIDDGRPTVVIRVKPPLSVMPALLAAFARVNASVVDTTGPHGAKPLLEAIKRDDENRLERGTVFIAKGRFTEGVNIRTLTHAYFWGIPQSMTVLEQFLGRAMRMRFLGERLDLSKPIEPIPNVLPEWAVKSKVTLFFSETEGDTPVDHARLLLRAVLFLSTFSNPSWVVKQLFGANDGAPTHRGEATPVDGSAPHDEGADGAESVEILDQRKLALAIEMIEAYQDIEWRPRKHPLNAIDIKTHPAIFSAPIYDWYKSHPALRLENDPVLDYSDIQDALNHWAKVLEERDRAKARKRASSLDDDLMQGVLADLAPAFREDTYEDNHYALGSENMNYWAERLNRELLERIDGQPKTEDEIYERVLIFCRSTGRWPHRKLKDEDQTPKKPVPFSHYNEILKRQGRPGLIELICMRQEKDLSAAVRDLLAIAATLGEYTEDRALNMLREQSVVGRYYAEPLLAGGLCGISYPLGGDPLEMLALLTSLLKKYKSRTKMEVIKSVYRDEGLDGVRARLGAITHGQTDLAQTQPQVH
jgi:hypothetical protein